MPYVRWLLTKTQTEVTEAVASVVAQIQAEYEGKVVFRLHSDRGKEFVNKTLHQYTLQQGLWCTTTEGSDPRANGLAERYVGILKEKARAMLLDSRLDVKFWPWAMLHASYLLRKHAKGEEVPKDVPCFGAQVVVRQRQRDSNDFMPRGLSARYLGVCERIVGGSFVLYQSGSVGTTACARPVLSPGATQTPNPTHRLRQKVSWADLVEEEQGEQGTHLGTQPQPDLSSEPPWQAVPRRRRLRGKQKAPPTWETLPLSSAFLALVENVGERGGDEVSAPAVLQAAVAMDPDSVAVDVPAKTVLASVGEEKAKWWQTGETELHGLQSHMTYVPIDAQHMRRLKAEGAEVLLAKAVWTLKPSSSPGGPKRHKLRVAVCGNFSEIWDVAVARPVLREAAGHKWAVGSLDIKSAFLNPMLPQDRVVIVTPPRVLVDMGLIPDGQYWLLSRALYGLRECPHLWAQKRDARLNA